MCWQPLKRCKGLGCNWSTSAPPFLCELVDHAQTCCLPPHRTLWSCPMPWVSLTLVISHRLTWRRCAVWLYWNWPSPLKIMASLWEHDDLSKSRIGRVRLTLAIGEWPHTLQAVGEYPPPPPPPPPPPTHTHTHMAESGLFGVPLSVLHQNDLQRDPTAPIPLLLHQVRVKQAN